MLAVRGAAYEGEEEAAKEEVERGGETEFGGWGEEGEVGESEGEGGGVEEGKEEAEGEGEDGGGELEEEEL